MDSERAIIVWASDAAGRPAILRLEARTGTLRSVGRVEATFDLQGNHHAVLTGATDEIVVLNGRDLYVLALDGQLIESIELPFVPRSILAAQGDLVYLAASQVESVPVHRFVRKAARLDPEVPDSKGNEAGKADFRYGVLSTTRGVWTVSESEYRLEQWDPRTLERRAVLAAHPAVLDYLLGPYSEFRIVGAHLIDDRFLWIFVRLRSRTTSQPSLNTAPAHFAAQYDGLVEVIDLENGAVIANRYFPDFDLAGWVSGPIGYRINEDGTLELLHCAVEFLPQDAR